MLSEVCRDGEIGGGEGTEGGDVGVGEGGGRNGGDEEGEMHF